MDANTHSNKSAPEQLQLKSRCPHVTNATQTGSKQPDTPQTTNTVQTRPTSEQQDISRHTGNTVQSVSELPQVPVHSTETEQFYYEIADEDAVGTAPATIDQPVQLPLRVNTHRLCGVKACLAASLTIAMIIILTVVITLVYVLKYKLPFEKRGKAPITPAATTPDILIHDYFFNESTANVFMSNTTSTSPIARQTTSPSPSPGLGSSTKILIAELQFWTILSAASDGQLLVGKYEDKQLHVYSDNGNFVKSLAVPFDAKVIDAVWSPREHHVVCTIHDDISKTVVLSVTGDVISQKQMINPRYLSVSFDNVIYVTNYEGLSYSSDNGTTWNSLVNVRSNDWRFEQALKVTPNSVVSNYTIWAVETNYPNWRLSIYTPGKRTWTDVVLPNSQVKVNNSRMAFDGRTNIYMTDWENKAVHVWSVNGQYVRQLLSSQDFTYKPENVALNKQRTLLYVSELGIRVCDL